MPHAELKYSSDLDLDAEAVLEDVEATVQQHDAGAGACKGRAYPCDRYRHTHVLLNVAMLNKPHRDQAFTDALMRDLEAAVKKHLKQGCAFSLSLDYSPDDVRFGAYVTNEHIV